MPTEWQHQLASPTQDGISHDAFAQFLQPSPVSNIRVIRSELTRTTTSIYPCAIRDELDTFFLFAGPIPAITPHYVSSPLRGAIPNRQSCPTFSSGRLRLDVVLNGWADGGTGDAHACTMSMKRMIMGYSILAVAVERREWVGEHPPKYKIRSNYGLRHDLKISPARVDTLRTITTIASTSTNSPNEGRWSRQSLQEVSVREAGSRVRECLDSSMDSPVLGLHEHEPAQTFSLPSLVVPHAERPK